MSGAAHARRERVPVRVMPDHDSIAAEVAGRIATLLRERAENGRPAVLGLATGATPVGVYRELIRLHRDEGLDFSNAVAFNLDEYFPMRPGSLHSYHRYMREHLFDHVNIAPEHCHIPRGDVPEAEVEGHCVDYERRIREAGGIDFQILGIGRSGHIGFNEPGSERDSRTRRLYLDTVTRSDAAADFFGEENVPPQAITMGVATILEAREVVLLATGEHKAGIVRRAVEGEVHADVAATFLQQHAHATVYLDPAAASDLTRVRTPWLVGDVEWTAERETAAVVWLSERTDKSILHLATDDYRANHLAPLTSRHGSAEPLNGQVFNALISKIRGKSRLPRGQNIVVFSPHPDDDVISMGGLLRKLVENGNHITVAYQTSGNIAVFDHEVRRYLDFLRRAAGIIDLGDAANLGGVLRSLEDRLARKEPGDIDPGVVQQLKRIIRETEATAAIESLGLSADRARFLNQPFYQTGAVRKNPITSEDVEIVERLLEEVRPTIVFAAGDLSDPHGTHRMCLETVDAALARYRGDPPWLWLYRGAWQEWNLDEATVLVPLSEGELHGKVQAIFRHESQKDLAPFPGPDPREFWQRVVERNRNTANRLAALGLPAYYAIEAYVTLREGQRVEGPEIPTSSLADEEA
ncbi:glucosamine-6-phosphate deaminase [Candidatus Palauibacter soopunensis]|uniref:glucosamine-6-phosphate deaminase n=1 Tax=Candidatus Palauibacter soopunensis TaxID=3056739 RepID=UPI002384558B|nr:glucosamine-6-phosphate deaminase [Candidatus Palauibacter soopunensis]MDE2877579.1 glucosamine-6-phosphate deaminase [Candidatus Palauibacter soopunensis]